MLNMIQILFILLRVQNKLNSFTWLTLSVSGGDSNNSSITPSSYKEASQFSHWQSSMLEESNSHIRESNLGTLCHSNRICISLEVNGFTNQNQCRWFCIKIQITSCCSRLQSNRRNQLLWHICTCCTFCHTSVFLIALAAKRRWIISQ